MPFKSDWEAEREERNWQEGAHSLPPYPKPADLIEIDASAATSFRFFVDPASVSVSDDGVVRYTLVARSASGAQNISYEGIRCHGGMARAYAFGTGDGRWSERSTDWHPIQREDTHGSQYALWRDYFCPYSVPIRDPAEGIAALRNGGHRNGPRAGTPGR